MATGKANRNNGGAGRQAGNGGTSNGGTGGGGSDKVNGKMVDAVEKSTEFVFGIPPGMNDTGTAPTQKYNAGAAISYEKVAQATALEVQDAADYQRNMLSINGAAQGKALALMFEDIATGQEKQFLGHAIIYALSIAGTFAAGATAEFIGNAAGNVLENYGDAAKQNGGSS